MDSDKRNGSVRRWTTRELQFLCTYFVLRGVQKIRLTGGEPLLRADLPELIAYLNNLRQVNTVHGLCHLTMTTNGLTFNRKAARLKTAGLDSINISLDSLRPERVTRLTGSSVLKHALSAIYSALEYGYNPVKVNCVVMRGFNDDELSDFVQLTQHAALEVRFIEYMPFGGNRWDRQKLIPFPEILNRIRELYPTLKRVQASLDSTAKLYQVPGWVGKIGLITSMTANFCSHCTRLRLTSDGYLKTCLHSIDEVNLMDPVREANLHQFDVTELTRLMSMMDQPLPDRIEQLLDQLNLLVDNALNRKKKEHAGMDDLALANNRSMVRIGG